MIGVVVDGNAPDDRIAGDVIAEPVAEIEDADRR
jgi:hypothetical protein